MRIAGAVSLITGAASGFGKEFTNHILKNGGKVFAVDLNQEVGAEFAESCGKEYGNENIKFMKCDVSDTKQLQSAFDEAIKTFNKLDIVCNNAGIVGNLHKDLMNDLKGNLISKTVNVDLTAVIEGTYLGIHKMSKQKGGNGGVIINVASYAGLRVAAFAPVYTAAKHGVTAFTHAFKYTGNLETDGVRVNSICPSFVDTPLVQQDPAFRENILKKFGFAELSDVVKVFEQCIVDESLNGDSIAILPKNLIKKAELPSPQSKI